MYDVYEYRGEVTHDIVERHLKGSDERCDVATAVWLLDFYGSAGDPIVFQGDSTTPEDMAYFIGGHDARKIRITYFGASKEGKLKRVKGGTLIGMLRDRMKASPPPKPKKRRHAVGTEHCRTCVCFV